MTDELNSRRTALKYLGTLLTTAAGQEFLAGWLPSARAGEGIRAASQHHHAATAASAPDGKYTVKFFSPEQFKTIEMLTELIIPTDDQPGAKEARVAEYIDFLVFSAAEFEPEMQREWAEGLAQLDLSSKEEYRQTFSNLSSREQEKLLLEASLPEREASASHPAYAFYRLVKDTTVGAFYTSKMGLIDVLGYQGRDFLPEFPGCTHPEHQT
ncbi:MAG: gluconate 2-dehydrogenase subunit 3 family protein [Terriglobia bacterium]